MGSATISVDEFQALEAKVMQAVELIRKERDARAAAEAELATTKEQLEAAKAEADNAQKAASEGEAAKATLIQDLMTTQEQLGQVGTELAAAKAEAELLRNKLNNASSAQTEIENLHREREAVRLRVEKMLSQMDELL